MTGSPWLYPLPYSGKARGEGLAPLPYQCDAARFALERPASYMALDAGLGKTIVACLIQNAGRMSAVYLCPPFLVANVAEEFKRWTSFGATLKKHFKIVPDSLIARESTRKRVAAFVHAERRAGRHVALFVDEAHRFKNEDAKRTRSLLGGRGVVKLFDHVVYMSGTPLLNRPIELWPILSASHPGFKRMSRTNYGMLYCAGQVAIEECKVCKGQKTVRGSFCRYCRGRGGFNHGLDFSGASRMDELAACVHGSFMLRIRKKDVLKDLPPKRESLVFVGANVPPVVGRVEREILKLYSPTDLMQEEIDSPHVATYRRELGLLKVEPTAALIEEILSESDESALVFGVHVEVLARLADKLSHHQPYLITGKTPMRERHEQVKDFQASKTRRLFILNIEAGGVGFTLTKARRVVFIESPWVPALADQAADRAHRIGQTGEVLVQHVVFKNSIDRKVIETGLRKRRITQHI